MSSNDDREQAGSAGEDSALLQAWRQASDEQPPARLDAEVLAAARRSVETEEPATSSQRVRPLTRSRWMRWQPLAAAATVAGLAFVLVQTIPREREIAPPVRIEIPAPAPSPAREVAPPVRGDAPAVQPGPELTLESASGAPAAGAAADVADTTRNAEADQRKGVMTQAPGEAASAEAAAPATEQAAARASSAAAPPSAADWTTRIEALYASGDLAGAAEALREFRAADPAADSHLPESLRDWARTVE